MQLPVREASLLSPAMATCARMPARPSRPSRASWTTSSPFTPPVALLVAFGDAKIEEMIGLAAIAVDLDIRGGETIGLASRVADPRFQLDLGVVPIL